MKKTPHRQQQKEKKTRPKATATFQDEFCAELSPKAEHGKAIRRLQRKLDRQRRAANPHNYDAQGRVKKGSKKEPLRWKHSRCSFQSDSTTQ